ncbi:unnamed protein product [Brassica oleracea]
MVPRRGGTNGLRVIPIAISIEDERCYEYEKRMIFVLRVKI